MKKKGLIWCFIILLLCVAAAWRFWPRSFGDALDVSGDVRVTKCWVTLTGVTKAAEPYIDVYDLPEDVLPQVQTLLVEAAYRPDWQMLLPWTVDSAGSNGLGISAMVFLDAGGTEKTIHLMGPDLMACFSGERNRLYRFGDAALLQKLRDWALTMGILQ